MNVVEGGKMPSVGNGKRVGCPIKWMGMLRFHWVRQEQVGR